MKKVLALCLAAAAALSLYGCGGGAKKVEDKKVAYIMQMAPSDIFEMWSDAAEETAERLGMEYTEFFCGGSDEQWQETIRQCAADGYDGLLLSHGGTDYSYTFLSGLLEEYPDLKLVTFDTIFEDENGQTQKIDGVTQFFQQDSQLAGTLIDYITEEICPEKIAAGEPANILKVWVGPGFLSAFDRRETGYAEYEQQGLIKTVETIGPTDFADARASVKEAAAAALAKYEPGEIDVVWCCYDLYAQGVYEAITEGGYDIPMVSVDICNEDIEKMAAEGSPWKACATTNWYHNGEYGMRALALELAGEYDKIIDPSTGTTGGIAELPASLITQEMVAGGNITVDELGSVADQAYSDTSWLPASEWMNELLDTE